MSIEKLTIQYEKGRKNFFHGEFKVGFNPAQLSFSSSVTWDHIEPTLGAKSASAGTTVFRNIAPDTLTLSLFFDSYAPYVSDTAGGILGAAEAPTPESVVKQTAKVMDLARVDRELHRPPMCRLLLGASKPLFCGVLQKATRTYTLFMPDGTPVRATMECTFMEVVGASKKVELHSSDVTKTYTVLPGDTLMGIAAALFGDGGLWRLIAVENGIENPRSLTPGRLLSIPKVQ